MKKLLFKLTVVFVLLSSCNNEKSTEENTINTTNTASYFSETFPNRYVLDWNGIYTGTTFCVGCTGIKTEIELKHNLAYVFKMKYSDQAKESVFENTGFFTWNESGDIITLHGIETFPQKYLVAEGALIQLDAEENPIQSKYTGKYTLKKQTNVILY